MNSKENNSHQGGRITSQQNESFWLWLTQFAHELNNDGQTFQMVMAKVQKLETRPNKDNIYYGFVKQYIQNSFHKERITELNDAELKELIDALTMFFGHYFHITLPFPSYQQLPDTDGVVM